MTLYDDSYWESEQEHPPGRGVGASIGSVRETWIITKRGNSKWRLIVYDWHTGLKVQGSRIDDESADHVIHEEAIAMAMVSGVKTGLLGEFVREYVDKLGLKTWAEITNQVISDRKLKQEGDRDE